MDLATIVAQDLHDGHFQILKHLSNILGFLYHRRDDLSNSVLGFSRKSGFAKYFLDDVLLFDVGLKTPAHNLDKRILLVQ